MSQERALLALVRLLLYNFLRTRNPVLLAQLVLGQIQQTTGILVPYPVQLIAILYSRQLAVGSEAKAEMALTAPRT